jgi:NADH dehydrogenase [ubiquinone] 1 alpha subcomplex assembly factor 7
MPEHKLNPGFEHFRRMITSTGPINVARYMTDALAHPDWGYYTTQEAFGAQGDFITAPEVSQVFGEMLGLWCAQTWMQLGKPAKFGLVELGPGRGTLMADMITATKSVPGFHQAVTIHVVEMSKRLREIQREKLDGTGIEIQWFDRLDQVSQGPSLFVANEFIDALPMRQFQHFQGKWHERQIALNDAQDELIFVLSPSAVPDVVLPKELSNGNDGDMFEVGTAGQNIADEIGTRITQHGGAALIIDYGYAQDLRDRTQFGDTLQAVKSHNYHALLQDPGRADLTAHVDFMEIARSAANAGAAPQGITTQANFLNALGIVERIDALIQHHPDTRENLQNALRRLTHEDEMGQLFKVIVIGAIDAPRFPGI